MSEVETAEESNQKWQGKRRELKYFFLFSSSSSN
jgi:hypothetical protein